MRYRISEDAKRDLKDIGDYIARNNKRRAHSFVAELKEYCRSISLAPYAYPLQEELGENLRRGIYGRYLIFYTVHAEEIRIERILHGARDIDDDFFATEH